MLNFLLPFPLKAISLVVMLAIGCCTQCTVEEIEDCKGTCVPAYFLSDNRCDKGQDGAHLNCFQFGCDANDCGINDCTVNCTAGQTADCYGECAPDSYIGDGTCDNGQRGARFDCPMFGCDGGDCNSGACAPCTSGNVIDCNGNCFQKQNIGDGKCDNGAFQGDNPNPNYECATLNFDDGDCVNCPAGSQPDCFGGCATNNFIIQSLGSGTCQGELNCSRFNFDDCITCPAGSIASCSGNCVGTSMLGDGICNEELNCVGKNFDNGDCIVCQVEHFSYNCFYQCSNALVLNDTVCDPVWNCTEFNYDGGDCLFGGGDDPAPTDCPVGFVPDCEGLCSPVRFIGDGTCDDGTFGAFFNCSRFDCDDGDCCNRTRFSTSATDSVEVSSDNTSNSLGGGFIAIIAIFMFIITVLLVVLFIGGIAFYRKSQKLDQILNLEMYKPKSMSHWSDAENTSSSEST